MRTLCYPCLASSVCLPPGATRGRRPWPLGLPVPKVAQIALLSFPSLTGVFLHLAMIPYMKCPSCGLACPPETQRCDCGYDFVTDSVHTSLLQAEPQLLHYRPLARSAKWARSLLLIVAAWSCVAFVTHALQAQLVAQVSWGSKITQDAAAANDARVGLVAINLAVLSIASAITFLVWFYKARCNLPALGADDCKYSRGWAVGGFFVPFLNLIRPLQVMREVWHASDPEEERFPTPIQMQARRQVTPSLVGWWWALFLLPNALDTISGKLSGGGHPSLSTLQDATWLSLVGDILRVAGAIVAAAVVKIVTDRQASRYHARLQRPLQPEAAPSATGGM